MSITREREARLTDKQSLEARGYSIGRRIGKGSYATVRTAKYTDLEGIAIQLACKIVDKKKAPRDFLDKFLPRELSILKNICCPHIIKNGDLLDYVLTKGALAEAQSRRWFHQIFEALKYLHSLNVAHRDLKCENLLLSRNMNIKLADFGFARYCTDASGSRILSQTYCGSGSYAAPEVISGVPYNPKIADIWSLGVVLFIMVNCAMPFDDTNLNKLLQDQKAQRFHFEAKLDPAPTPSLRLLINSLLEPDVIQRWNLQRILKCEWLKTEHATNELGTDSMLQ